MINWIEKTVPLGSLKPYERNPRILTKDQYEILKEAIESLGYRNRIVCAPDLTICGGHARLRVLQELGMIEVPVLVSDRPLTHDEFRKIIVQDNLNVGQFDFSILAADFEMQELKDWGMPDSFFGDAFESEPIAETEDVPEEPAIPRSVIGDVWIMGDHKIICGDSTSADVVAKLLGDVKPHLMVTDPPYGVEYDAEWREKAGVNGPNGAKGKVLNDNRADWHEAWALFPGNIAYVWHAGLYAPIVADSLTICGFSLRSQIIWAKSQFVFSRGDYHWHHEACWYVVKGTGNWKGDRKQSTLWQIDKPQKSETGHSTQKPIECMRRPMENNSEIGDAVYDPFSGSGTSIIAAEQIGRRCFAIELSPAYVDVAVMRWQNLTGKKARHAETGEPFDLNSL
jgi:DNA modification methylase